MSRPLWPGDPRRLGDYELVGRLGEGGMGSVYLGRSPGGRLVAVKIIRPEHANDPEFRGRFRSEVTRARQVPPFCTAAVLDADPDHPTPYLVVEFVDGPSLSEVVQEQGTLSEGTLHSVAVGMATALAAIHGAGVVHRDLKPQNVLFSLGTPKVIDFGIARAIESSTRHTKTDQMIGTVSYMAPERFDDQPAGPPSDVFAWGAVVAYAATGRTPFGGESPAVTVGRILTQPPKLDGLNGPLRELVERSLAKDPRARPTAHELLTELLAGDTGGQPRVESLELRRAAEAVQQTSRVRTDPGSLPTKRRRVRRIVLASVAAVLVLCSAGLFAAHSFVPDLSAAISASGGGRTVTLGEGVDSSGRPSVSVTVTRQVAGPSIVDRLDRKAQWKATNSVDGQCLFSSGYLIATSQGSSVYQCSGPADTFSGDQSVQVKARVLTKGACAAIWFRWVSDSGYRLVLCEKDIRLGLDNSGEIANETKTPTTLFTVGQTHTVRIDITDGTANVSVDGSASMLTMALSEPSLAAGQVRIGAYNDANDGDSSAAFTQIEIHSL